MLRGIVLEIPGAACKQLKKIFLIFSTCSLFTESFGV